MGASLSKNGNSDGIGCLTSKTSRRTSAPLQGDNALPDEAGVAQLVRVPACHAGGRGFEPRHSRHSRYLLFSQTLQSKTSSLAQSERFAAQTGNPLALSPRWLSCVQGRGDAVHSNFSSFGVCLAFASILRGGWKTNAGAAYFLMGCAKFLPSCKLAEIKDLSGVGAKQVQTWQEFDRMWVLRCTKS